MNDPLGDAVRLVFGELVSPAKIEALRRELRLPDPRREVLVSAVPLQISIERGPDDGALRIIIDGFDPIPIAPASRIIVRPEGHGVVLEREA